MNNVTYCVWLYNVRNCPDELWFQKVFLSNGILCIIFLIPYCYIYYDLLYAKKTMIWNGKRISGLILAPTSVTLFLFLSIIHSFLMYTDSYKSSYAILTLFVAFSFLLCAILIYFYDLAMVMVETFHGMLKALPKKETVFIGCVAYALQIFIALFVVGIPSCYFVQNDDPRAEGAFTAGFVIAGLEALILGVLIIGSGRNFIVASNSRFTIANANPKLKNELLKIKATLVVAGFGLMFMFVLLLTIGLYTNIFVELSASKAFCFLTIIPPTVLAGFVGIVFAGLSILP